MKRLIQICFIMLVVFMNACNKNQKIVRITDNLTWVYIDEVNSSLLWKQKVIIGPGTINLKCDKLYVWGMLYKENVSIFFLVNLKTGEIIKNSTINDIVFKYNINIDWDKSYTQTEIFGEQKSMLSIKQLEEDIKILNK